MKTKSALGVVLLLVTLSGRMARADQYEDMLREQARQRQQDDLRRQRDAEWRAEQERAARQREQAAERVRQALRENEQSRERMTQRARDERRDQARQTTPANSSARPAGPCGRDTCEGCCDSSGQCQPGTTDAACGYQGYSCSVCGLQAQNTTCTRLNGAARYCAPTQAVRANEATVCGPRTCQGCCDDRGRCQPGTAPLACGGGGSICSVCGGPSFPDTPFCYELKTTTRYCVEKR